MHNYKSIINKLHQRLTNLDNSNNKIVLEVITDLESTKKNLWYILKVINRTNKVIHQEEINGIPREYITNAINQYKCKIELEFYNIINGKKTKDTSYVSNT